MSNFSKIFSILLILVLFMSSVCLATDIDLNITDDDSTTSVQNNTNLNNTRFKF